MADETASAQSGSDAAQDPTAGPRPDRARVDGTAAPRGRPMHQEDGEPTPTGHLEQADAASLERLQILPATWRDFRSVQRLERLCFLHDAWPWFDVLAALIFPQTVRLKAVCAGQTVGFVVGDRRRRQDLGWIATLGVHPDWRRHGIGRRLLRACEAALGVGRVKLTVRASNHAARELYRQEGYVVVNTWRRYYRNGEDAVVMEKWMRGEPGPQPPMRSPPSSREAVHPARRDRGISGPRREIASLPAVARNDRSRVQIPAHTAVVRSDGCARGDPYGLYKPAESVSAGPRPITGP